MRRKFHLRDPAAEIAHVAVALEDVHVQKSLPRRPGRPTLLIPRSLPSAYEALAPVLRNPVRVVSTVLSGFLTDSIRVGLPPTAHSHGYALGIFRHPALLPLPLPVRVSPGAVPRL